MMILQNVSDTNSKHSGYTWDGSWILPYESIWSLMHKFSALNLIPLSECKKLFKPDVGHGKVITELGGKLSLSKLTTILGMGSELDKNLVYEIIHSSDREWLFSPYLRSCEICLSHGYHSVFHQVTAINSCPIHKIELTRIACKSCGSGNHYDSLNMSVVQIGGNPYTCTKCGQKHWHPYEDIDTSSRRKLLVMTAAQKIELDSLHKWFFSSAQIAPYGADMKRWNGMSGKLSFPAPIGMRPHKKSIYGLRGHEIQILRGQIIGLNPPESLACSIRKDIEHSFVQYGQKALIQANGSYCVPKPQLNDAGIMCLDAEQGIQTSLRQIYKSIRRHIAKIFLNKDHRRCADSIEHAMWWEPMANSNTKICPWAFAYLFWRRSWEKRTRANYPNKYGTWKHFLQVTISDSNPAQNEWVTLRIFALECYWTFQESVLLARRMSRKQKFSWDSALIRGRLIPYWHIDNQANNSNPIIGWWGRQPIHFNALRLDVSLNRHRTDVAMQAKAISKLSYTEL